MMSENGDFREDDVRKRPDLDLYSMHGVPMGLDHDACYRALATRDARFDGRMFIAVRTTGIYCRPICPARTPKRENVTFFATASAAQEAGYRPCLRCRPESSPDLGAWRGTSNTVSRALTLIGEGALAGAASPPGIGRCGSSTACSAVERRRSINPELRAGASQPGSQ